MRATWERGRWWREKWEREPVSISLTTLFCPFLSRLDVAIKTVNTSVSYNHSQVSRVSISCDVNSLCECVEIYVFKFIILWEHPVFSTLVSSFTRWSDNRKYSAVSRLWIRQQRLRISHSIVHCAAGFIVIKGGGKFFPLLGRLCPGRCYIFTEQMWF